MKILDYNNENNKLIHEIEKLNAILDDRMDEICNLTSDKNTINLDNIKLLQKQKSDEKYYHEIICNLRSEVNNMESKLAK